MIRPERAFSGRFGNFGRAKTGQSGRDYRGIPAQFAARIERMLDRLDGATRPQDMRLPGYRFHRLKGKRHDTYAVAVSGNWRLTFRFDGADAVDLDLEDYH